MVKNKLISWLIILSTIFSYSITTYAASADTKPEVQIIEQLGILDSDGEEDYLVTRSEFLEKVMKAFDLPIVAIDTDPVYTDITEAHKYYNAVISGSELGIITGYQGQVRPDDRITKDEAMTITVKAMGGTAIPPEFIKSLVTELKLYEGVTRGDTVSFSEMKRILYNALSTNSFRVLIKEGNFSLDLDRNETFFAKVWDIHQYEGVVESADGISIFGIRSNTEYIDISGKSFSKGVFSAGSLLGMTVKAFYQETDNGDTLIWAFAKKNNDVITYTYHDFAAFRSQSMLFYENNRAKSYDVNAQTTYILNGRLLVGGEISTLMSTQKHEYRLIDNNDDGTLDVVIANDPTVLNLTAVDAKREILVDAVVGDIILGNYASYSIADVRGNTLSIEELAVSDRVFAYIPGSTDCTIRFLVLEDTQNGIITGTKVDDDKQYIVTDDGMEYIVSPYSRMNYNLFELNISYQLYMDHMGEVIDAETKSRDMLEPIYLIKVTYSDDRDCIEAKIMKQDGTIMKVEFAKKVRFRASDGTSKSHKYPSELHTALLNGDPTVKRQLVFAEFDDEGKVKQLVQVTNNQNEPYHYQTFIAKNNFRWMSTVCSFENQVQLKTSTKVFVVPYDDAAVIDTTLMSVTGVSSFKHDSTYNVSKTNGGYNLIPIITNIDDLAADYLVIECPAGRKFATTTSVRGIVAGMTREWDEFNTETIARITILNIDGSTSEYECDENIMSMTDKGDIVYISHMGGRVTPADLHIFYKAATDKINIITEFDQTDAYGNPVQIMNNPIGWRYYPGLRLTRGTVQKIKDNNAKILAMQGSESSISTEMVDISSAKVLEFNVNTGNYEIYDKGHLKVNDTFLGILSNAKMMMFIKYVR